MEQKWNKGDQFWKYFQINVKFSHLSRRCPHRGEVERHGELKIRAPFLHKDFRLVLNCLGHHMNIFLKACKFESVLHVHASLVLKFVGCLLVEEENCSGRRIVVNIPSPLLSPRPEAYPENRQSLKHRQVMDKYMLY